jgi:ABC-type sugar transport system ATPase subunit
MNTVTRDLANDAQALVLDGVLKSYGDVDVIHGIDLAIREGEFIVFVGPSGCGKSTLLRMIAGLENLSGGEIRIDGRRVNDVPASERDLAMVFQSYALYPHMSVAKNLSFGLENLRVDKREIKERVDSASKLLQIEALMNRKPGQLSGGQRQRVAIGRAIVRQPRIFLFDEPLSNLDAELRVQMRGEISALHHRLGNTMIYVTHDQTEAMTMADRIVVLSGGKIEQFGDPLELYNRPANRFVAGFIGSPRMNFLEGELTAADTLAVEGIPPITIDRAVEKVPEKKAVALGIRPEDVLIADELSEANAASAGTRVPATANGVEQLGSESYLYCTLPDGQELTVHHAGQTRVRRGDTVQLVFATRAAHVFDSDGELVVPA